MDLQYPVGKFKWEGVITDEQRQQLIDQIEQAPAQPVSYTHLTLPTTPYV